MPGRSLRERANRCSINPELNGKPAWDALAELQDLYYELDVKFERYLVNEGWGGTGPGSPDDELDDQEFYPSRKPRQMYQRPKPGAQQRKGPTLPPR